MVEAIGLRPNDIEAQWITLKPYIDMALEYSLGEMSAEDVKNYGINNDYLFVVFQNNNSIKGVITIEVMEYENTTIVNVPHVGGKDIDEWLDLMVETVVNLAREKKADHVTSSGRQGWLRKLKPYGFKPQYTILSLTLRGEEYEF